MVALPERMTKQMNEQDCKVKRMARECICEWSRYSITVVEAKTSKIQVME